MQTGSFATFIENIFESPALVWLFGISLVILIFLACREVVCWYWKINKQAESLSSIEEQIKTTNALLRSILEKAGPSTEKKDEFKQDPSNFQRE